VVRLSLEAIFLVSFDEEIHFLLIHVSLWCQYPCRNIVQTIVPDHESQDRDVVLVRRTINLGKPQGVGKLERGRKGEGMGRGRSVYEQPGAKVDGIAPRKRRDSK
jgi:hypothetical protein